MDPILPKVRALGKGPPSDGLSLAEALALLPEAERDKVIADLTDAQLEELQYDWEFWARPKQMPPGGDWSIWILKAGRGFGKTRSGAGWVHRRAMVLIGHWIALVARNPADARDYMIEGPGGFLKNTRRGERPSFTKSLRRLTWPNGSWATIYSDEEPEQTRGFSGLTGWLDEVGKYKNLQVTWDNLQMGLREAAVVDPQLIITSTPKAGSYLRKIEKLKGAIVVTGSSYENRANLSKKFLDQTLAPYEGTVYGRQEIHAEDIDPEEGGIVKRSQFKLWPHNKPLPEFMWIVVSLDTAMSEKNVDVDTHEPDPTACTVWGAFHIGERQVDRIGIEKPRPIGIMCLDCWQDFLGMPELIDRAKKAMKVQYGNVDRPLIKPLVGPPISFNAGRRPDTLLIEDKSSGMSLRQMLRRERIVAVPYNPGKADKLQRLHIVSHLWPAGIVWLVESETNRGKPKSWYDPMIEQVCTFKGEGSIPHDDFVDSTTQALRKFTDTILGSVADFKGEPEDRDPPPPPPPLRSAYGD